MSCCFGEPRNGNEKSGQQAQQGYQQQQLQPGFNQWNGPVTHQPGPHPQPGFGLPPGGPNGYPHGSLHGPPQPLAPGWTPNSAQAPTPANSQWNTNSINSYTPLLDPNIVRPSPIHAQDFRASTVSPPIHPPSRPTSGYGRTGAPPKTTQQTMDEGKMSVSIDFGESNASDPALKRSWPIQGPRFLEWCVKHVVPTNELRAIAYRLTGLQE